MTTKIYKVLDIKLSIQESNPPNLVIEATGEVNTGAGAGSKF